MLDEKSMSDILSLDDVAKRHRENVDVSIDDSFWAHASEGVVRCGRVADCMHAFNGCYSSTFSRIKWEEILEKEGNAKMDEKCMINLAAENLSSFSPRERERDKASWKATQALGTCSANYFKAVIRESIVRDYETSTEDAAFSENNFVPDIGGLEVNTA